ncbi:MAG: HNH endonuclease [Rhodocyclaceae bacterium]|nr:HNH endonuclease [Rhodocyclaceae bacterium]
MAVRIDMPQIEASYEIAKLVFDSKVSRRTDVKQLHELHEMNLSSARDFIEIYRCMRNGALFQRTMNAAATDYYLKQIENQSGVDALSGALISVRSHIEYYESLRKTKLRALRVVAERFEKRATLLSAFNVHDIEIRFVQAVQRALQDTSAARRARLQSAEPIPKKIEAATIVFVRNPDVAAEVLAQAAGVCAVCKHPAPFIRKSNGTPYLEVHHRKQLAHGGEDM